MASGEPFSEGSFSEGSFSGGPFSEDDLFSGFEDSLIPDNFSIVDELRLRTLFVVRKAVIREVESNEKMNLEEKEQLAHNIQQQMDSIKATLICPICDDPGRLRVTKSLKFQEGIFQFVHSKVKRTTHQVAENLDPDLLQFALFVEYGYGTTEEYLILP